MSGWDWVARLARAEELASSFPFASEMLRFYGHIVRFQKTVFTHLERARARSVPTTDPSSWRAHVEPRVLLAHVAPFLLLVERVGPAPLAGHAAELSRRGERWWETLLGERCWGAELDSGERFFAKALLQPYAEYVAQQFRSSATTESMVVGADRSPEPVPSANAGGTCERGWGPASVEEGRPAGGGSSAPTTHARATCPFCGSQPVVGVLRPEGQGAKRSLLCSLCAIEWDYLRISCPACGEKDFDRLVVYTAGQFAYVRVDACESCKTYLKTVDLTKNGLAVPVVDELATTPLDLWAQEQGYRKLERNLLGM